MIPETPQKGGKFGEAATEQREGLDEEHNTPGFNVEPGRTASLSLGNTPPAAIRQSQYRGADRLHLVREVKILPTIENTGSHSESSRGSSTVTVGLTSSEYLPTPGSSFGSHSSSASTASVQFGAKRKTRDHAEAETTPTQVETTLSKDPLLELKIPIGLLGLHPQHDSVQRFKSFLSFKYRCIRRELAGPLSLIRTTSKAQEFQSSKDRIASGYSRLSCIIVGYNSLARLSRRLSWKDCKNLKIFRFFRKQCDDALAATVPASAGPGPSLSRGIVVPTNGTQAQQPVESSVPSSSQWKGRARADVSSSCFSAATVC